MGLIINQGKQDDTQDNKFDIITAENVTAQIVELKLSKTKTDTLEIKFKILAGQYKNRIFFDNVNYNPTSDFSWKYRALRKAAGSPYSQNEGANVDIEALLLNKAVLVDLKGRPGKNKAGDDVTYQNVTYKAPPKQPVQAEKSTDAPELTPLDDDDVPPFGDNVDPFTGEDASAEQQTVDNAEDWG